MKDCNGRRIKKCTDCDYLHSFSSVSEKECRMSECLQTKRQFLTLFAQNEIHKDCKLKDVDL